MTPEHVIRQKYIDLAKRYTDEKDLAKKIEKKHKFIHWITCNNSTLTDAEIEFLQESICKVEDLYY